MTIFKELIFATVVELNRTFQRTSGLMLISGYFKTLFPTTQGISENISQIHVSVVLQRVLGFLFSDGVILLASTPLLQKWAPKHPFGLQQPPKRCRKQSLLENQL